METERQEFEAWLHEQLGPGCTSDLDSILYTVRFEQKSNGDYVQADIAAAWSAWQIGSRDTMAKLRALCEGLEIANIDDLLKRGEVGDFRRLGEKMTKMIKNLI